MSGLESIRNVIEEATFGDIHCVIRGIHNRDDVLKGTANFIATYFHKAGLAGTFVASISKRRAYLSQPGVVLTSVDMNSVNIRVRLGDRESSCCFRVNSHRGKYKPQEIFDSLSGYAQKENCQIQSEEEPLLLPTNTEEADMPENFEEVISSEVFDFSEINKRVRALEIGDIALVFENVFFSGEKEENESVPRASVSEQFLEAIKIPINSSNRNIIGDVIRFTWVQVKKPLLENPSRGKLSLAEQGRKIIMEFFPELFQGESLAMELSSGEVISIQTILPPSLSKQADDKLVVLRGELADLEKKKANLFEEIETLEKSMQEIRATVQSIITDMEAVRRLENLLK